MSRLPAWRFGAPFEDFAGKLTGSRAREEANDCIAMTAWGQKPPFRNFRFWEQSGRGRLNVN
jgi:hypothetical protein